jgi:hypothetical protein
MAVLIGVKQHLLYPSTCTEAIFKTDLKSLVSILSCCKNPESMSCHSAYLQSALRQQNFTNDTRNVVPMDKLQLTGQNLVQVFNFRVGCFRTTHFCSYQVKQHNLKLKTRSKQLLGYLPLDITLPDVPGVSRFQ